MGTFRLDRTWAFPVPPGELWEVLARTHDFPRWWGWLRSFDPVALVEGATAAGEVRAPIPWALRFTVTVERVEPGRLLAGRVGGDLAGPARLELAPDGDGCRARLVWDLDPASPVFRASARVARPLLELGQRWVVDTGAAQFRRRAL